jgi:hypothetical protein
VGHEPRPVAAVGPNKLGRQVVSFVTVYLIEDADILVHRRQRLHSTWRELRFEAGAALGNVPSDQRRGPHSDDATDFIV